MNKPRCPSRPENRGFLGTWRGPAGPLRLTLAGHEQDEVETHRTPAHARLAVPLSP